MDRRWFSKPFSSDLAKQVADGASERWFYKFTKAHPKDDGIFREFRMPIPKNR